MSSLTRYLLPVTHGSSPKNWFTYFFLPTVFRVHYNLLFCLQSNYHSTSPNLPLTHQLPPFYRGKRLGQVQHKCLPCSKPISHLLWQHTEMLRDGGEGSGGRQQWVLQEAYQVSLSSGIFGLGRMSSASRSGSPGQNPHLLSTTANLYCTSTMC